MEDILRAVVAGTMWPTGHWSGECGYPLEFLPLTSQILNYIVASQISL